MKRKAARQFLGAWADHDRHGRRRWQYRKGSFSTELGTEYGSEDFVRRYGALVEGQRTRGRSGHRGSISYDVGSWMGLRGAARKAGHGQS